MRRIIISLIALLAIPALAQSCTSVISDDAHVLQNPDKVFHAAQALQRLGADPHIITSTSPDLPENVLAAMHENCPSWQSADGHLKSNLIIFYASPVSRKFGLFYGSEWRDAFVSAATIKMQHMAPDLRRGDYDAAFIGGIGASSIAVKDYLDNPSGSDAKMLLTLTEWIGGILFVAFVIYLIWVARRNRRELSEAKQEAFQARSDAAAKLRAKGQWLDEQEALNNDVKAQRSVYNDVSEDFSRLNGSETFNPDNKLTLNEYRGITKKYRDISGRLNIRDSAPTPSEPSSTYVPAPSTYVPPSTYAPPSSTYHERSHTTVVNNYSSSVPVIIPVVEEVPVYQDTSVAVQDEPQQQAWTAPEVQDDPAPSIQEDNSGSSNDFSISDSSGSDSFGGSSNDF